MKLFSRGGAVARASAVAVLAAFALAGPAGAQTPAPPARPAPAQAPSGPVKTETFTFGGWSYTCQEQPPAAGAKTGKRICWGTLRVSDAKLKRVVLVWSIGRDAKDEPTISVTTPTGILVPDGVDITIGKKARKLAYQWCAANECQAGAPYDQAFANDLAGAKEATVSFRLRDGRQVEVKVGITGVDKVLAALKKG